MEQWKQWDMSVFADRKRELTNERRFCSIFDVCFRQQWTGRTHTTWTETYTIFAFSAPTSTCGIWTSTGRKPTGIHFRSQQVNTYVHRAETNRQIFLFTEPTGKHFRSQSRHQQVNTSVHRAETNRQTLLFTEPMGKHFHSQSRHQQVNTSVHRADTNR